MNEGRERQRRAERRRAKRNRRVAIIAALICVFVIGLICGGRLVKASRHDRGAYKYYTSITVDCNETLWDIANEYMTEEYASVNDYIREVQEINSIVGTEIYYGEDLLVPYYSVELKE